MLDCSTNVVVEIYHKKSNFSRLIVETLVSAESFEAATLNFQPFVVLVELLINVRAFRH